MDDTRTGQLSVIIVNHTLGNWMVLRALSDMVVVIEWMIIIEASDILLG